MSKLRRTVAALIAGATLVAPGLVDVQPATAADGLVFTYEVKVDEGVNPASHAAMFLDHLGIPSELAAGRIKHLYPNLIGGYAVELTYEEAAKAERIVLEDSDIAAFNRSFEVSSGPVAPQGVGDLSADELEPLALERLGMSSHTVNSKAVIAILDTGTDADHPDLNVTSGFNAVEPGQPIVDVVGHGTATASVAAAIRGNGQGIAGSAPGATVVPVKVLGDTGSGSTADIIAGLEYVAGLVLAGDRVDVVNLSLGGQNAETRCGTDEDLFHEAICELVKLDVAVVVSAGNSGGPSSMQSPANYEEVVTVSAFADYDGETGGQADTPRSPCTVGSVDDSFATFSSYGENVDINAIGVCNVFASPTTWENPGLTPFSPYGSGSGTSFSAPLVTGALARYRAANTDQPVRVAVEQLLRYSALYGGTVAGDPDGIAEPVLWLGDIPRWEG